MLINTYIERFKFFILAVVLLISAILVESSFFEQRFNEGNAMKFREVLLQKEVRSNIILKDLAAMPDSTLFTDLHTYVQKKLRVLEHRGISFLVYESGKIFFWSSNDFYIPQTYDSVFFQKPTVFIDHTWFYVKKATAENRICLVLVAIKNEFPYQNKFLVNDFHDDFNIPTSISISASHKPGYYDISDAKGEYILSLSNNSVRQKNEFQRSFSIFLYFASNLLFLFFFANFARKFRKRWIADLLNVAFMVVYLVARAIMVREKIPYIFGQSSLFDPQYYALSDRFPSLGDLLLDAIFLWHFVYQLQRRIKEGILFGYSRKLGNILVYVFPFIICSFGFLVDLVIKSLVVDSNINFEAHKVLDINNLSIYGYLIMAIMIFAFVLLANGFIYMLSRKYDFSTGLLIFLPGFVLSILMLLKEHPFFVIRIAALLLMFFLLLFMVNYRYKSQMSFSVKVLMIFLSSVFISLSVDYYLQAKKVEIKKIYALNLSNEKDILTEQLLREVEQKMKRDSTLQAMMDSTLGREDEINRYLQNAYYGGFLNKYKVESTICGDVTGFSPGNKLDNCDSYFRKFFFRKGVKIANSSYHFLQNLDGSVSYVDSVHFLRRNGVLKLYIELKSRLITEELGYPELLLNEEYHPSNVYKDYSYARYKNGNLVTQHGDFPYSLSSDIPSQLQSEYALVNFNGYDHLFYKIDEGTAIVVSNPETSIIEILISISYVFLFFFLLLMCLEFVVAFMNQRLQLRLNFKGKIQASFIGVLVLSLILIGISMIYLNLNQYKVTQYEQVNEKLQSILVELEQFADDNGRITPAASEYLSYKLDRLSNIYFTDINIYGLNGSLITSSRMEIFDWGLVGSRMNIDAYTALSVEKQTRYEHLERIGDLDYLSAYAVVKNDHNKPLAYLNVPYFTKQSAVTQRVSSLVVAFINIYVLLIVIATLIAVFISNKVTNPLQILKDKIRDIKLGGKNDKIDWDSNDEIGGLIKDYNRMVNELSVSASKLAETEREMAWREMAKQIAHEIKNPLTPMKLNIQLLNRAWDANDAEFGERLKRVSTTLIEQIDTLAATATEFSNFAKSSENLLESVDLVERLNQCVTLFSHHQEITFTQHFDVSGRVIIIADKEKINRVFINILKNAIQSIPGDRDGKINIFMTQMNERVRVSISDNGAGIAPGIQHRLFEPNFTTKSSGSGLGLAICRTLVESFDGTITFETRIDEGTTFHIEFPVAKNESPD